ncbi:hypothetical protein ABZU32_23750 [Sphaerisporangium sp. NPDC005288]|uniref:hypothetical protein n=1 Tax=Sphaerisporangium sp. NPDC005288 TaxID=3155114 RepID=UPI0033A2AF10
MSNCGGICGTCPIPCFLLEEEDPNFFESLVERGPEGDFEDLSDDMEVSDTTALGCGRWDDPSADCPVDSCVGNFFCYTNYSV